VLQLQKLVPPTKSRTRKRKKSGDDAVIDEAQGDTEAEGSGEGTEATDQEEDVG
jgi:hypothetical protein